MNRTAMGATREPAYPGLLSPQGGKGKAKGRSESLADEVQAVREEPLSPILWRASALFFEERFYSY